MNDTYQPDEVRDRARRRAWLAKVLLMAIAAFPFGLAVGYLKASLLTGEPSSERSFFPGMKL